jgi:hypothetical protein
LPMRCWNEWHCRTFILPATRSTHANTPNRVYAAGRSW